MEGISSPGDFKIGEYIGETERTVPLEPYMDKDKRNRS